MITRFKKFYQIYESMNSYDFTSYDDFSIYIFDSVGKEIIKKAVIFTETKKDTYNLALVNIHNDGSYEDIIQTNNNDIYEIGNTILQIIIDFLDKKPNAYISIIGNTKQKIRIYSLIINRYYELLNSKFQLNGYLKNKPVFFKKNEKYDKIVFSRKSKVYEKFNLLEMRKIKKTYGGHFELSPQLKEYLKKEKEESLEFWETCVDKYLVNGQLIIPEEDYITDEEAKEYIKNKGEDNFIQT